MKIYFSVSLSQMDDRTRANCKVIIDYLKSLGHTVIPEEVIEKSQSTYVRQSNDQSLAAQKKLTKLKKLADLIVVEVTKQSLAVGQEVALALSMNKPVIALYDENSAPHILRDEGGDLLLMTAYSQDNLLDVLSQSLEYASSHQDVRFNFFISPAIGSYLDWISQNYKIPRSVYLRNLIEKDMTDNKEYHG